MQYLRVYACAHMTVLVFIFVEGNVFPKKEQKLEIFAFWLVVVVVIVVFAQTILGFWVSTKHYWNKESSKIFVHVLLNSSRNFIKQYLYYFLNILNRLEQNIFYSKQNMHTVRMSQG